MGELLDLFSQTAQVVQSGLAVWGASQEQRREWEYQKALSAARDGVQLLGLTVKSTGDFTQHQHIYENGGIYENQQGQSVQVSGIGDLRSSIIERYGTDPAVANAIELAWPAIEQSAQNSIREYSHGQEMISESARMQEDLSHLWRRMEFGNYAGAVEAGTTILEGAQRTGVWNAEQALAQENQFMSQGVAQLKADLEVVTTRIPNVDMQIEAINTAIDGGLDAGLFRVPEEAEKIRADMIYGVQFQGLKAELLASALNPTTFRTTISLTGGVQGSAESQPLSREERLELGFDQAMERLEDTEYSPWLRPGDRSVLRTFLRGHRQEARADMNYTRDMLTERMTDEVREADKHTPESYQHILQMLDVPHFKTETNHSVWYSLWDRYSRLIEAEAAGDASAHASYTEEVKEGFVGSIITQLVTGDIELYEAQAMVLQAAPALESSVRVNPQTGQEESYLTPYTGILDTTALRTVLNFIDNYDTDSVAKYATDHLITLIADKIPESDQDAYIGVAIERLEDTLNARKFTKDENGRPMANPQYAQLKPADIEAIAESVYYGVTTERRRSAGYRSYQDLPTELADLAEVGDRTVRVLGLKLWTVRTQDEAEKLLEQAANGDFAWAQETFGSDVNQVLDNLAQELTNRFADETGCDVMEAIRDPEQSWPIFRAATQDGDAWWFRYRYESRGKQLQLQVYPNEARGWIDVTLERQSSNGAIYLREYNGGW